MPEQNCGKIGDMNVDVVATLKEAVKAGCLTKEHRGMAQAAMPSGNTGVRAIAAWNVERLSQLSDEDKRFLLFALIDDDDMDYEDVDIGD